MLEHRWNRSGLFKTRWIDLNINPFWNWRVLGAEQTTRKPLLLLLLRIPASLLLRVAERQFLGLLIQEPPRSVAYPALSLIDLGEAQKTRRQKSIAVSAKYFHALDEPPNTEVAVSVCLG